MFMLSFISQRFDSFFFQNSMTYPLLMKDDGGNVTLVMFCDCLPLTQRMMRHVKPACYGEKAYASICSIILHSCDKFPKNLSMCFIESYFQSS